MSCDPSPDARPLRPVNSTAGTILAADKAPARTAAAARPASLGTRGTRVEPRSHHRCTRTSPTRPQTPAIPPRTQEVQGKLGTGPSYALTRKYGSFPDSNHRRIGPQGFSPGKGRNPGRIAARTTVITTHATRPTTSQGTQVRGRARQGPNLLTQANPTAYPPAKPG